MNTIRLVYNRVESNESPHLTKKLMNRSSPRLSITTISATTYGAPDDWNYIENEMKENT
jgi:hypothetical protein